MTTSTTIPCKRPKVTPELIENISGLVKHACLVPRCGWTFVSVKTAQEVKWHKDSHKRAVPASRVVHDVEWAVYCEPCGGHRRTFGTRADADAWLAYHLSTEHGLVTC